MVAVGALLVGTLVSIVLTIRRGQTSITALSLVAVVAVAVVLGLGLRAKPSALVGKWVVIAVAALAALPLVVSASGR